MSDRVLTTSHRPECAHPNRSVAPSTALLAAPRLVAALAVLAVAAATAVGVPSAHAKGTPPDCDSKHSTTFRWAQKTAQDRAAGKIPQAVQTTTIIDLSKQPAPTLTTTTGRRRLSPTRWRSTRR